MAEKINIGRSRPNTAKSQDSALKMVKNEIQKLKYTGKVDANAINLLLTAIQQHQKDLGQYVLNIESKNNDTIVEKINDSLLKICQQLQSSSSSGSASESSDAQKALLDDINNKLETMLFSNDFVKQPDVGTKQQLESIKEMLAAASAEKAETGEAGEGEEKSSMRQSFEEAKMPQMEDPMKINNIIDSSINPLNNTCKEILTNVNKTMNVAVNDEGMSVKKKKSLFDRANLLNRISNIGGKSMQAIMNIGSKLTDFIKLATVPLLAIFAKIMIVSAIVTAIAAGLMALYIMFKPEIDAAIDFVKKVWDAIMAILTPVWEFIKEKVFPVIETVSKWLWDNVIVPIGKLMAVVLDWIWESLKGLCKIFTPEFWKDFGDQLKYLWDNICFFAKDYWNKMVDFFNQLWEDFKLGLQEAWNNVKDWINETWEAAKNWIKNLWTKAFEGAKKIWNGVTSTVSNAWDNVKKGVSNLWTGMKTGFKNAWASSKKAIANAYSAIKQWFIQLFAKFKKWLKDSVLGPIKKVYLDIKGKYIDPIIRKLQPIIDQFQPFFDSINNFVGRIRAAFSEWNPNRSIWENLKNIGSILKQTIIEWYAESPFKKVIDLITVDIMGFIDMIKKVFSSWDTSKSIYENLKNLTGIFKDAIAEWYDTSFLKQAIDKISEWISVYIMPLIEAVKRKIMSFIATLADNFVIKVPSVNFHDSLKPWNWTIDWHEFYPFNFAVKNWTPEQKANAIADSSKSIRELISEEQAKVQEIEQQAQPVAPEIPNGQPVQLNSTVNGPSSMQQVKPGFEAITQINNNMNPDNSQLEQSNAEINGKVEAMNKQNEEFQKDQTERSEEQMKKLEELGKKLEEQRYVPAVVTMPYSTGNTSNAMMPSY